MSQKTQLNQLITNQAKKNKQLDEFRYNLVTQMYRSLCDGQSYYKRVKKLFEIQFNKGLPVSEKASKVAIQFYNKINKRKQANYLGVIITGSIMYAYLIHKFNVSDNINSVIYEEQRKELGKQKEAIVMSDIQANRINGKCFYLCSSHNDSAEDHKDYQGKLYIDAYCTDEIALAYAKKHRIKEYQWVIDAPVYMVVRPNCRHYFKALDTDEVLNNSVKELINKYNMHHKIGPRGAIQTLSSRDKKIEFVIKSYEDRLKMHNMMNNVRPNEFLKSAIHKDTLLINKWKKKL